MGNIIQHIIPLKEVLQLMEECLDKFCGENLLAEKVSKLNNIEKSIRNLHKGNTAIPTELRELKLTTVNETHNWQEAKNKKPGILDLLIDFITIYSDTTINQPGNQHKKRIINKPRVKKFSEQVPVSDLLKTKLNYYRQKNLQIETKANNG